MRPYALLECSELETISRELHRYLLESTDLLSTGAVGWHFLDYKQLLRSVPELIKFFASHRLVPDSASAVILYETGQLPLHVDELPVTAKINFPVSNTTGWTTKWYSIDDKDLKNCARTINKFGSEMEDLGSLPRSVFTFLDETPDHLNSVVVFNSRIPHEVIKIDGDSPRIIVSFTFVNEPLDLLL